MFRSFLTVKSSWKLQCFSSESAKTDSPDTNYYQAKMEEFLSAKNRLAYIMGADPNTFTEGEMKGALTYLIPHHIRPVATRPHILHPDELKRRNRVELKVLRADVNSRPLEPGFYTSNPFYHNFLLDVIRFKKYLDTDDESFKPKNITDLPEPEDCTLETILDANVFKFFDKDSIELVIGETLSNWYYDSVREEITGLIKYPGANELVLTFVRPFFRPLLKTTPNINEITEYTHESGVQVVEQTGKRKSSSSVVKVWRGDGYITVNGRSMSEYFKTFQDMTQILYPLNIIGALGKFSVDCQVVDGGSSGQSGAIRIALAKALAFLEPQSAHILSGSGLLWTDYRRKEGKKPGRMRARRGFTWRKR